MTTGSTGACVSNAGVRDMVGNVSEWVADWADQNAGGPACTDSTTAFGFPGTDEVCFGGDGSGGTPSALIHGDSWPNSTVSGVFSVLSILKPSGTFISVGFRCAR